MDMNFLKLFTMQIVLLGIVVYVGSQGLLECGVHCPTWTIFWISKFALRNKLFFRWVSLYICLVLVLFSLVVSIVLFFFVPVFSVLIVMRCGEFLL